MFEQLGSGISGAIFDKEHLRRYALWRIWDRELEMMMFVGLNSSTANVYRDDPTVVRMCGFAKGFGFGGLWVGNLRSNVSPRPEELLYGPVDLPGGPLDQALKMMSAQAGKRVVGWGNWGARLPDRKKIVLEILGKPVYCLAVTQTGEPGHPLYLHSHTELKEYVVSKHTVI